MPTAPKLLIITPPPFVHKTMDKEHCRMIVENVPNVLMPQMIKEIGSTLSLRQDQIIDAFHPFKKFNDDKKTDEYYMDCIHPNTKGYHKIAEIVKDALFEKITIK